MGSSNRHWPSMFKSKPTNNTTTHHQWHHDLNNPNIPTATNPYTQGCDEERTPEPKPRWNPRPDQIRILEAIFNSGMVNPPRDEIRRIRAQLQEFGQVGDANVFYWFQNRKSRTKNKQRHLQPTKPRPTKMPPPPPPISAGLAAAQPSSSSSSNKSSPSCNSSDKPLSLNPFEPIDLLNSPTTSVNQPLLQGPTQFLAEPFFFPGQETAGGSISGGLTHGISFPDLSENVGNCSNVLLGHVMQMNHGSSKKDEDDQPMKLQHLQISYADPNVLEGPGLVEPAPPKSTVFINDVYFEVAIGVPFNVREAFGDDAVLVSSSGQRVPTDEWGVTQQPLQHGAFYYLLRSFAPSPHHRTIPLDLEEKRKLKKGIS